MKRNSTPSGKDRSGNDKPRGKRRVAPASNAGSDERPNKKRDEEAFEGDREDKRSKPTRERATRWDNERATLRPRVGRKNDEESRDADKRKAFSSDNNRPVRQFSNSSDKRKPFQRGGRSDRDGDKRSYNRDDKRKPFGNAPRNSRDADGERKSFSGPSRYGRDDKKGKFGNDRSKQHRPTPIGEREADKRRKEAGEEVPQRPTRPFGQRDGDKRPFNKDSRGKGGFNKNDRGGFRPGRPSALSGRVSRSKTTLDNARPHDPNSELIRLNKFIASGGVCSRREADTLITTGVVTVNGEIVTELGTRVKRTDIVKVAGESLRSEKPRYLLLNKPKDYITTVTDPRDRKTVMHLLGGKVKERVYPVGRLDRATTGLLLLTNDGDLAKKLTHPAHGVQKVYRVQVSNAFKPEHLKALTEGFDLEDGFIQVDAASYAGTGDDKHLVGIEIHSGRNRIIRRMMGHLGYTVIALDRVSFAGLTKKALPRGTWRELTAQEIGYLKMV